MAVLAIGKLAEEQALAYLQQQKLILVARNFRCRGGEIDLIMRDSTVLTFIEVRYRQSAQYGTPYETVTFAKQKKIIRAAQFFLQQKRFHASASIPCRFDVVALTGHLTSPHIEWIKNAFQA